LPKNHESNISAWSEFMPDYELILHTGKPEWAEKYNVLWDYAPNWQSKADLLRYWLMANVGGIYADTDTKPLKPFDHLVQGREFVADILTEDYDEPFYDNYFIGSDVMNGPMWTAVLEACENVLIQGAIHPEMPFHLARVSGFDFDELPCETLRTCLEPSYETLKTVCEGAYVKHYPTWQPEEPEVVINTTCWTPLDESDIITPEQEQHRLDTCNACEFLSGERCAKCGCSGRHRSRISTVHCPIGKW